MSSLRLGWTRRAIGACLSVAVLGAPAAADAARPLVLGFTDGIFTTDSRGVWLDRAARAGAQWTRIEVGWVAPNVAVRPAGFNARDPADPHYDFSRPDAEVRAAAARGLRILALFTGAPLWAQGPHRPADAPGGSWRPDPRAIEEYGFALATRYSGRYPDPANPGRTLPRVAAYQLWNEPNLSKYLTPQWVGNRPAAPGIYRGMLNGFWAGVKAADRRATIVTAGTGPFGDPQIGGDRLMPAFFWRQVLCLDETNRPLGRRACPAPARFDILSHHPYSVGNPAQPALNADDVSIPDIGKLRAIVRAAERARTLLPREHHRLWVTEVSYDSGPPDPQGVPIAQHARFLEQTLYLLWRQQVDTVFWQQIVDQPPVPSYAASAQSGVFYIDGRAKPAFSAYRFPFVVTRAGTRGLTAWGRSPSGGRIEVQHLVAGRWRTVRSLVGHTATTFVTQLGHMADGRFRAVVGSNASIAWMAR